MEIKGIEFRDLPLQGIEFAFNANEIIVSCAHHAAHSKEFEPIKLYFNGVKNIFTDHLELQGSADIKISDLELEDSSETKKARFQLLTDSSKMEIVLTFNYNGVHYSW
jgi:hypothetical protein